MVDYPLTQIDWSDPGNWYGEDVGSNFDNCTGSINVTYAAIEFPHAEGGFGNEYTFEVLPEDLTALPIVGVRVELEIASGSGQIAWVVAAETGVGAPIIQRNDNDGAPTLGVGFHTWDLGATYDETGTPWDLALFLERLAVSDPPATPEVTGSVAQQDGGPCSVSLFRLVAYTLDPTVTVTGTPPRRIFGRSDGATHGGPRVLGGGNTVQGGNRTLGGIL